MINLEIGEESVVILFILTSVTASSARALLLKKLSVNSASIGGFGRVNALLSVAALAVVGVYAAASGNLGISVPTFLSALLYALFTIAAQLFYMRALHSGDVSTATFFYSCGFVIPAFAGTFLFDEELTVWRIIGVVMLVIALRLNCGKLGDRKSSEGSRIISALLAMASAGLIGLIQKLHQSSSVKGELGGFLVIAFAACTLVSVFLALSEKEAKRIPLAPSLTCGACIASVNILNTVLSGMLPALIFFPVLNGSVVIASAIAARVFCGEVLGRRRILALCIGMAAIVMIAI